MRCVRKWSTVHEIFLSTGEKCKDKRTRPIGHRTREGACQAPCCVMQKKLCPLQLQNWEFVCTTGGEATNRPMFGEMVSTSGQAPAVADASMDSVRETNKH